MLHCPAPPPLSFEAMRPCGHPTCSCCGCCWPLYCPCCAMATWECPFSRNGCTRFRGETVDVLTHALRVPYNVLCALVHPMGLRPVWGPLALHAHAASACTSFMGRHGIPEYYRSQQRAHLLIKPRVARIEWVGPLAHGACLAEVGMDVLVLCVRPKRRSTKHTPEGSPPHGG